MVYEVEQGTDEWLQLRCGRITASSISDLIEKTGSGSPKAGWKNYIAQKVCERLSGEPAERGFVSKEMQWGTDHEADARALYEFRTGRTVKQVGFVTHEYRDYLGASPDGLVDEEGMCQIKCPNTATHLDSLKARAVPTKYYPQMQVEMFCAGKRWSDFVSYDPRVKLDNLTLFVKRLEFDEKWVSMILIPSIEKAEAQILADVAEFKDYVNDLV